MNLLDHFHKLRKADLQGYYMRWFPNEEMISDRDKLEERLQSVMSDPGRIRERFDRLARSSQDFVAALLTRDQFRGTVGDIRGVPRARSIENFEIENLLRNLKDEGWIIPASEARNGTRSEVYVLPDEIGEGLGNTVDVECREAVVMLSLAAFLRHAGRENTPGIPELIKLEALKSRIRDLPDPELRLAVKEALDEHGGILPLNAWRESSGRRNGDSSNLTADWRQHLEENLIGTTGVLSLKSYGIELEEDCLIVFQELVHSYTLEQVVNLRVENDKEYSVGVDLLIDIRRMLELARTEEVEVTREGSVFKKTEERLVGHLLTSQHKPLFEGSSVEHVIRLCKRLRLLNQDDHHLRADPARRRIWAKKRITTMLRTVFELYQNESRGDRWSFHQPIIRELFLDHVVGRPGGGVQVPWKDEALGRWVPARPLLTAVVARFLCSLEERDVAKLLKEFETEEFHRGHFVVVLDRLAGDLAYWVIHRLALVGFVDLGFQDGKFHSVRMSSLGCRYFKLDVPEEASDGQIVVNPDYEILLFPGGKNEADHNYMIGSFAERTGTEWVKRYRITRESVKRGVISGNAAEAIVEFLEGKCRTPIPANVKYSIIDWAQGVEPIIKQRTLLLKARSVEGADALCQILEDNSITHERVGEMAVTLRGTKQEKALMALQDTLRAAGLFLE